MCDQDQQSSEVTSDEVRSTRGILERLKGGPIYSPQNADVAPWQDQTTPPPSPSPSLVLDFFGLDLDFLFDACSPPIPTPHNPVVISPPDLTVVVSDDLLARNTGPSILTGNSDSVNGSPAESGDKIIRLSPPFVEWKQLNCPDWSCVIKERMSQALRYFKESTEQHVLAQVWAPVKNGGRYVLTTCGQPFFVGPHSNVLHQYRMVSVMYMFSLEGESDGVLGLPGRVFMQKMPEWTPNVQYYSSQEYPLRDHALHYNIQGTLALPIFEPSLKTCLGVLELIMTSPQISYAPEIDKVCKALEAVNLGCSEVLDHPSTQIWNKGHQKSLAEILEILTLVCETHKLPLAQTWVPCGHHSVLAYGGSLEKSCSSFDGSCLGQVCLSTTETAFYVVDASMWGFHEACAEHHLEEGQGVVGRAFVSHRACFCEDISQFCKTEYPLVHYARMFGLTSSFAICSGSTHTGNDDYILEFFLAADIMDKRDQQTLLHSILATMKGFSIIINPSMGDELDSIFPEIQTLEPPLTRSTLHPEGVVNADKIVTTPAPSKKKNTVRTSEVTLQDLKPLIGQSRAKAAETLGVSVSTFKRIREKNGISKWPDHKSKKQCSRLMKELESFQGAQGPVATSFHTRPVGSSHQNLPGSEPESEKITSTSCSTPCGQAERTESSKDLRNLHSFTVESLEAVMQEGVPKSTCSDLPPEQALATFSPIRPLVRGIQDART